MPGQSFSHLICSGCHTRSRNELNLLRYDYVDLSQLIPRADGHSEVKIFRPKPSSVPPVNMAVFTLRSELAWVAVLAETVLRAALGESPRVELPQREGHGLQQAVYYLEPRVDHLAALSPTSAFWQREAAAQVLGGPQVLVLLGRLHHRARTMCGLSPKTIAVPGSCPHCQSGCLRRHDDDPERVRCAVCALVMSRAEYLNFQRQVFSAPPPA